MSIIFHIEGKSKWLLYHYNEDKDEITEVTNKAKISDDLKKITPKGKDEYEVKKNGKMLKKLNVTPETILYVHTSQRIHKQGYYIREMTQCFVAPWQFKSLLKIALIEYVGDPKG